MITTNIGRQAERHAAEYLQAQNYKIHELNWKTRYCEIDIVAEKSKTVYFIEVKYRRSAAYGSGLDYITARKQGRMKFAAEMWVQNHDWKGNYQLGAIEVSGPSFEVTDFLETI